MGRLDLGIRQSPRAGETLFVDYAGQTMPVVNALTGEGRAATICIAVLGASNSTCAEATWSQSRPDGIGSHVRAFPALGGVPQGGVPDNRTAAVSRAHRYEPTLNRTYAERAQHDGVAIGPTRPARPRDKAKGEVGVQVVARWMLARLRPTPSSRSWRCTPRVLTCWWPSVSAPARNCPGHASVCARPWTVPPSAPAPPSAYAAWTLARVNIDDHVEVDGHSSSVPYRRVQPQLDVRLSAQVVAIFHKGHRGARHQRSRLQGRHTTGDAHLPKAHHHAAEWPPHRLVLGAAKTGEATARVVETIRTSRPPPQQGFRACVGLRRLGKRYGEDRLEAAWRRALRIGACSYKRRASLLKHALDPHPLPGHPPAAPVITHDNIRGAQYSHTRSRSGYENRNHAAACDF